MSKLTTAVLDHYRAGALDSDPLVVRIASLLGTPELPLAPQDLAAFDQFHFGGFKATAELARRVAPTHGTKVLDAGCGLGGPARFLAEKFGCHVTGVDLSPEFVAACNLLTSRTGSGDRVTAEVGDLTALRFDAATFDLVWSQHVAVNIVDRARLYGETRRVLKPGGCYAAFDPVRADGERDVIYPVPWATTADTSMLLTRSQTEAALAHAGLDLVRWDDVTDDALGWAARIGAPDSRAGPDLSLLMGPRMPELVANFIRNLRDGRLRLAMLVCDRA